MAPLLDKSAGQPYRPKAVANPRVKPEDFGDRPQGRDRQVTISPSGQSKGDEPKSSFSTHANRNVGSLPLIDLVVMAGRPHPFPFRTRP
ncbi:hypothetical protein NT26_3894 [Pseudorhizobium banfieldiae]|uniref:Uncharacterized protein n=1 Tax=Pseudorhizobium banfieldiae TaxID=1125847 RepID=L0NIV3_9HYPH|nr:hypothetical protein NT26_3090 [Pseudorhizobium banfieldiae]CCF21087.1 hypothetical protein NT26_3364 [Pseudorhizobium banfieldiae]CCF21616.1 hypothetical protein NT26_3894 [Pseudorhizobium banfieldiae]